MRISDWSSDVCSSDLFLFCLLVRQKTLAQRFVFLARQRREQRHDFGNLARFLVHGFVAGTEVELDSPLLTRWETPCFHPGSGATELPNGGQQIIHHPPPRLGQNIGNTSVMERVDKSLS